MNRNAYRLMTWVLWLVLPVTALRYWMVWDQLPERMATHFNASGHANGWMSREASLGAALLALLVVLSLATVVLRKVRKVDSGAWALWGLMGLVAAVLYGAQEHTIRYNLTGETVSFLPFIVVCVIGMLALIPVYVFAHRGQALSDVNAGDVIAEEVHSGKVWIPLFVLPLLVVWVSVMSVAPQREPRIALGIISLVMVPVMAFTWDGFHYRITRHGLEIRMLGFRLRSIPAEDILSYAAEGWSWVGGYGIRGIGADRAYVWGNRVLHIHTRTGEVYLGHAQPEKLVGDLDRMKSLSPVAAAGQGIKSW